MRLGERQECPLFNLEGPQHAEYACDQCERNELEDEVDRLCALVEKRESQLVYAISKGEIATAYHRGKRVLAHTPSGRAYRLIDYDGTTAGLLAAVDEATKEVES